MFYKDYIMGFLNSDKYSMDSPSDMTTLLFDLSDQRSDCFMDEKACFVSFILISLMNSELNKS